MRSRAARWHDLGWCLMALAMVCGLAGAAGAQVYADDRRFAADLAGEDAPGRVGRISFMSDAVSLRTRADSPWTAAELNYPVTTGTAVWTEPGALAVVHIGDVAVRIGGGTEIEFIDLDDRVVHAYIRQGGVNVQVRSFPTSDRLEVSTPRGTATLIGPGTYRIDAGTDALPTRVAVFGSGQAWISGNGPGLTVRSGDMALLRGDDRVVYDLRTASQDAFDRWAMARDPIDRPVASAGYVPPDMTGYEDLDRYGKWTVEVDYGPVWYPSAVPIGWVPYRGGRWAFVLPWGWTWVDDLPWGFAPFHYGRWIFVHSRWCWHPGHRGSRPVFAPALVGFVGDRGGRLPGAAGPAVGWFPLGPRDAYRPWYKASAEHVRAVNAVDVPGRGAGNRDTEGDHPYRKWATVVDAGDFARGKAVRAAGQTGIAPALLENAPIRDIRPETLPRPQRDGERVQRVAVPPAVNLRSGVSPGFDPNRNRDEIGRRGPPDVRRGEGNPPPRAILGGTAPTVPSPLPSPFSQERAPTGELRPTTPPPFQRREEPAAVRRQEVPEIHRTPPQAPVQSAPPPQFRAPQSPPPQIQRPDRRRDGRPGI